MELAPPETEARPIAAIAYLLGAITAIACLVIYRDEPFVQLHAWQSLLLSAFVAVAVAAFDLIPLLGLGLVYALFAGAVLLSALAAWKALRGQWFLLPLLGDVALDLTRRRLSRG